MLFQDQLETEELLPDFWIVRNQMSTSEQEYWVQYLRDECAKGWEHPVHYDGSKLSVKINCFGYWWSIRGYKEPIRPMDERLAELAKDYVGQVTNRYQSYAPETCIVNYYDDKAKLGLHKDQQEHPSLLLSGSPIVTIALGDTCRFAVREELSRAIHKFDLFSGEVVVMFGEARNLEHGVLKIYPKTSLIKELNGRLSLTMREVKERNCPIIPDFHLIFKD